jgi:hypothetical protein
LYEPQHIYKEKKKIRERSPGIKMILNLPVISVMLILLVGCPDQFGSDGGMRTIVTGMTATQAV